MRKWHSKVPLLYSGPVPLLLLGAGAALLLAIAVDGLDDSVNTLKSFLGSSGTVDYAHVVMLLIGLSLILVVIAVLSFLLVSTRTKLKQMIFRGLCKPKYGNPLKLREGELIPVVHVRKSDENTYKVQVKCQSAKYEDVANLENVISNCLVKRFDGYAVTMKEEDLAKRYVEYTVENVIAIAETQDIIYDMHDPVRWYSPYILPIRGNLCIDFSKIMNASMLICGRTRSGKTTAVAAVVLVPVLGMGPDNYGSRVTIIDPKNAELSQCSHVLSPKLDGDVTHIIEALIEFDNLRIKRQQIINENGAKDGNPVKWWDVGMRPSICFIDEYVALQGLMPKKGTTEHPEYNLMLFQSLIRRIATQGASAGCFLIISTAEASVGTGGLEAVVNNACGIRFLFKPSKEEAMYLWNKEKLEALTERNYSPGNAWISIDDGENYNVRLVKFPKMMFGEYAAISRLMEEYHAKQS